MTVSWFDGIQIQVLAGFSAADGAYGVWGTGLWGTATWGPDTVFTDISQYVASVQTSRGFSRELSEWTPGQASILLRNRDGRFSPSNLLGPYVVSGLTGIRPWRPIIVNVEGTPIFTGYAISWQETYPQGSPRAGGADVVVSCIDEMAALARFEGLVTASQGGGEATGKRIHRILDNAGHTGLRAVDVGRVALQPTVHDQNAVSEMKLVTDSENGALYVDADGAVTFEDRYYLVEHERSNTVQAIFGDGGLGSTIDAGAGDPIPLDIVDAGDTASPPGDGIDADLAGAGTTELPYADIVMSYDGDQLVNIVSLSRAQTPEEQEADIDPPVVTVQDETSRALYGDSRYTRTDLVNEADADLPGYAAFYLAAHKDAELRVDQITFQPRYLGLGTAVRAELIECAVSCRIRDRVQVWRRPPGGETIVRDCHIAGISHSFDPVGDWRVTFDLWSASVYDKFEASFWDGGLWDGGTWFF